MPGAGVLNRRGLEPRPSCSALQVHRSPSPAHHINVTRACRGSSHVVAWGWNGHGAAPPRARLPPAACHHTASFIIVSWHVAALTPRNSPGQLGLGDTESHAGRSRHALPAPALPPAPHPAPGHLLTLVGQFLKTSTCLKGKKSLQWRADCAFTQPSQASCCPHPLRNPLHICSGCTALSSRAVAWPTASVVQRAACSDRTPTIGERVSLQHVLGFYSHRTRPYDPRSHNLRQHCTHRDKRSLGQRYRASALLPCLQIILFLSPLRMRRVSPTGHEFRRR